MGVHGTAVGFDGTAMGFDGTAATVRRAATYWLRRKGTAARRALVLPSTAYDQQLS